MIQIVVDEIDERIKKHDDEALTLQPLSKKLGYSEFHTTRRFKELSGMLLKDYIRLRKLALPLIDVRDTKASFLDIAVKYGFSSHEAFTRSLKSAYGITQKNYRRNPSPVALRTKINTFDRYILELGEIGMVKSTEDIKVYFITMSAHKFLHVKNYESNGYWDFWEKQDKIPDQNCDSICGLLENIKGKLDGKDDAIGKYSGQIMAHIYESDGRGAEAYGVRLPTAYNGATPKNMSLIDIPEMEYIVFEHGLFDYEEESDTVGRNYKRL